MSPRISFKRLQEAGLKGLVENFLSLSVMQAANYILPFITLPYLVRVIGVEKFGLVFFAQAVIQYLMIATDYGFNLSATREIASERSDMTVVSRIYSAVMALKLLLLIVSAVLLIALVSLFDKFNRDATLYLLTFGMVIGNLLFPVWFFQGMERMKYSTSLNILARLIFVVTIFIFVRQESHYIRVPVLTSAGAIVAGLLGQWVALHRFRVRLRLPALSDMVFQAKYSFQFFLSRLSGSVYSSLNTVILGIVTTNELVGYYVAAEKIFIAARAAFHPLGQALYPYMTSCRNTALYRKAFYIAVGVAVVGAAVGFAASAPVIEIVFGAEFAPSAAILRLFCLIIPVAATSLMLGYPLLAAFGKEKYANLSITVGSLIHLGLLLALIPIMTVSRVVLLTLMTESIVLLICIYGVRKHRLWTSTP